MTRNVRMSSDEMLEKIFYYMNCLFEEKDFNKSILLLTDLGRTLVDAERTSFWYKDVKKGEYWTLAAIGEERITVPCGKGIVGASIENNEVIRISEPYEDERFNQEIDKQTGYLTKSILCMPVTNGNGKVIGAYQAINKIGQKEFSEQDAKYLSMAAVFCGKILEAQLYKEDNQVDQLTGLKNRKGFWEMYDNDIKESLKEKKSSIIMCDIDYFKKVNDTYGHNVGDAVLVHVADLISKEIGKQGAVFRWGGEEFVTLLPEYARDEAVELAENIRKKVADSQCYSEGNVIKITMSFGVRELVYGRPSTEMIKEADDNLYRAKAEGRNKVIG